MTMTILDEMQAYRDTYRYRIEYNVHEASADSDQPWDMSPGAHSVETESGFRSAWLTYTLIRDCPGCSEVRLVQLDGYGFEEDSLDFTEEE